VTACTQAKRLADNVKAKAGVDRGGAAAADTRSSRRTCRPGRRSLSTIQSTSQLGVVDLEEPIGLVMTAAESSACHTSGSLALAAMVSGTLRWLAATCCAGGASSVRARRSAAQSMNTRTLAPTCRLGG
jgi:hypothetical protein